MFNNNYLIKALDLFTGPVFHPTEKKRRPKNKFKILSLVNDHFEYTGLEDEYILIDNKKILLKYFIGAVLNGRDHLQFNGAQILSNNDRQKLSSLFRYITDHSYVEYISFFLTEISQKDTEKLVRCPSCNSIISDDSPENTFWPCPNCGFSLNNNNANHHTHCKFSLEY